MAFKSVKKKKIKHILLHYLLNIPIVLGEYIGHIRIIPRDAVWFATDLL